jgi:gamma-glutamyl hercynylcysteine S-oxide synthase
MISLDLALHDSRFVLHSLGMDSRVEIRAALERAREATDEILAAVPEARQVAQVAPGHAPLVWDLALIAHFEELWLLRNLNGSAPLEEQHAEVYAAFRARNGKLPPLRPEQVRAYADHVREHALHLVDHIDFDAPNALVRRGFVFGLVLQHELQHQETMLETLQLDTAAEYPTREEPPPDEAPAGPDEILVEAGSFILGATDEPWAYDNELVPHEVEVRSYYIDRQPVTNAQFVEFVAQRGYDSAKHWSERGWEWRENEDVKAPLYWQLGDHGWERVRFGRREPVPLEEPVQHVSFFEAEAYAHWAGKRLPTEAEWERAAAWDERRGKSRFPWGREFMGYEANLARRRFRPAPVGSYAGGASPSGCVQLTGDVWEWTSSHFLPYPGFLSFPYPEYSEVYFGEEYRVLRGGSWATDPLVARGSFRSWELPGRRHHFAGFRCARDA